MLFFVYLLANDTYMMVYNIEEERLFEDQQLHPAFCHSVRTDLSFDLGEKTVWNLQAGPHMPPLEVECSGTKDTFCLKPLIHNLPNSSLSVSANC